MLRQLTHYPVITLSPDQAIGPFTLTYQIWEGSATQVWHGHSDDTGSVAIKAPRTYEVGHLRTLRQEYRILRPLDHPQIPDLHTFIEVDNVPCLVTKFIEGPTLHERLHQAGALSSSEVINIGLQLATVLEYLHSQGVIHLDLKPNNIIVPSGQPAVLLDYGISQSPTVPPLDTYERVMGTAGFAAPEIMRRQTPSVQSDMFSLGVALFTLLMGAHPYGGATDGLAINQRVLADKPDALSHTIPSPLRRLVRDCLLHDPILRPTAAEVRHTLTAML